MNDKKNDKKKDEEKDEESEAAVPEQTPEELGPVVEAGEEGGAQFEQKGKAQTGVQPEEEDDIPEAGR